MTSENLAILFSMCLVCGSNQLEDGRISTTVKKILQKAIDMWPQLRAGMGIDTRVFDIDLLPPTDTRDSEDPLDEARPRPSEMVEEGHRIVMNDSDGSPYRSASGSSTEDKAPALPPRRSRAASIKAALGVPSIPKRKPAPHHYPEKVTVESGAATRREDVQQQPTYDAKIVAEPPRYSTLYDRNGGPLIDVVTDDGHTSTNGFEPSRRANFSHDHGSKSEENSVGRPLEGLAKANSFRRKPVDRGASGSSKAESERSDAGAASEQSGGGAYLSTGEDRSSITVKDVQQESAAAPLPSPSETNAMLARMAAQQANTNLAQRITLETPPTNSSPPETINSAPARINNNPPQQQQRSASSPITAAPEPIFRKPSWPASANRPSSGGELQIPAPRLPRVRAASPGLLKRMSSLEVTSSSSSESGWKGESKPVNLRQTSVDDLRRLYEERAGTVRELVRSGSGGSFA
jgi:Rho GTPase-activating protein 1